MRKAGAKFRILLADQGHKSYYDALTCALEDCHFIPAQGKNPAEYVCAKKIDLVIMEFLDDPSSVEFIRSIRTADPFLPIIVLAPNGSEDLAVRAFRCGARDYFRKPFNLDELKSGIESALGKACSAGPSGLQRGLEFIARHYSQNIRLARVSREAGMSVSSFSAAFRKNTGTTFSRHINALRVKKAAEMLRGSGASMNDIAFACGFTNQYHFTRTFKKLTKMPPRGYRDSFVKKTSAKRPATSHKIENIKKNIKKVKKPY